jgi:hypothetical protein
MLLLPGALDRKETSIFKQLVGGDPLWANVKGDDGRMTLQGHYPVILACNGKSRLHLDSGADAWMRSLLVLSLKTPDIPVVRCIYPSAIPST